MDTPSTLTTDSIVSNNIPSKKVRPATIASIGSSSKAAPIARNLTVSVFPIPTNLEHQLSSSEEEEALDTVGPLPSLSDPFLLVNLRKSRPPPRPKGVYYLFLLAFLDFCLVTLCTILLVHDNMGQWLWRKAEWDMIGLGILRVFAVVGVASSIWLRELGWILGGVCGISSLYIIFKTNVIFQHRRKTQSYHIALLATSFLFCIIHLIAYIVVTADTKRRDALLKSEAIEFTEETNNNVTPVGRDVDMGASVSGDNSSSDIEALPISISGRRSQTKNYGSLNGR